MLWRWAWGCGDVRVLDGMCESRARRSKSLVRFGWACVLGSSGCVVCELLRQSAAVSTTAVWYVCELDMVSCCTSFVYCL